MKSVLSWQFQIQKKLLTRPNAVCRANTLNILPHLQTFFQSKDGRNLITNTSVNNHFFGSDWSSRNANVRLSDKNFSQSSCIGLRLSSQVCIRSFLSSLKVTWSYILSLKYLRLVLGFLQTQHLFRSCWPIKRSGGGQR